MMDREGGGHHVGAWGGPPGLGGGGGVTEHGQGVATKSSYVGIASLNTSVRDKKTCLRSDWKEVTSMLTSTCPRESWITF